MTEKYNYYVSVDEGDRHYKSRYNDMQVADAMAEWSKAISEGNEYVLLEALRERLPDESV